MKIGKKLVLVFGVSLIVILIVSCVSNGYKAIENGVVSGYKAVENKFVDTFLTSDPRQEKASK